MTAPAHLAIPRTREDLVHAAAANMAAWHEASLRALGVRTRISAESWAALDPAPPIYFSWIDLAPAISEAARAERRNRLSASAGSWSGAGAISDPWHVDDLTPLGFDRGEDQPWMVRPAGARPGPPAQPPELEISRVTDMAGLEAFEDASFRGFEVEPVAPLSVHASGILADPRFHLWMGTADGAPVSVAMGFVEAGVVGVYGVATVPRARRRGYGTALTARAMAVDEPFPMVLQPSPIAEAIYGRLGFSPFATFATWYRHPTRSRP